MRDDRGVTLIELMVAITLVAALMTGMLMVMRTGLVTYDRLNHRLEDNRRVVGLQHTLERQIEGLMPVIAACVGQSGVLTGDAASMRFVSTDSLAEGSRGYPRLVEYRTAPDERGGVRLMMIESFYTGVPSAAPCGTPPSGLSLGTLPVQATEMAGRLAYCRLSYQEAPPDLPLGGAWIALWNRPLALPRAVRIEMAPLDPGVAGLPMLTLNVPLRINRQLGVPYVDE